MERIESASSGKHRLLYIKYAVDKWVGVDVRTPYRFGRRQRALLYKFTKYEYLPQNI